MMLDGLFAAAMVVSHLRWVHYCEIAKFTGGFFFVWTLWALGGLGGFTFILSARGLWSLGRGQPRESNNPNMERADLGVPRQNAIRLELWDARIPSSSTLTEMFALIWSAYRT